MPRFASDDGGTLRPGNGTGAIDLEAGPVDSAAVVSYPGGGEGDHRPAGRRTSSAGEAAARRLPRVPIIHTPEDMGRLRSSARERHIGRPGNAGREAHVRAVGEFRRAARRRVEGLDVGPSKLRLYQDALPARGFEGRIVRGLAGKGGANHRLPADPMARGAILTGTESPHLLVEEYEPNRRDLAVGIDGTFLLMCEDGRREAMVGTIGLHDAGGERRRTIHPGATPEDGEATLLGRMGREVARVKPSHPGARRVGPADGTEGDREFPGRHAEVRVIDFWDAAEYLSDAGDALFAGGTGAKRPWPEASCHRLEHEPGAARQSIRGLKRPAAEKGVSPDREDVARRKRIGSSLP